jgi:von Willebrand factor type A domain/von Willebrand factor type A C-terminal domain
MTASIQHFFNPFLAVGKRTLDTVLSVKDEEGGQAEQPVAVTKAIGFLMDTSGSMNEGGKDEQARRALIAAIDAIPSDTAFFVTVFNSDARTIFIADKASETQKEKAKTAVRNIVIGGGTCMSEGLTACRAAVERLGADVSGVYMLTDGENDSDDAKKLSRQIEACKGVFQCDCRGVGTNWRAAQVRQVADGLMGVADAVADPSRLSDDIQGFLTRMGGKTSANAKLVLTLPKVVKLVMFKQVSPQIVDLTRSLTVVDEKTLSIDIGALGAESMDFQLNFELPERNAGEQILACKAAVVVGKDTVASPPVVVGWSQDENMTTRINKEVAHYSGQAELAQSIQQGLEAKASGNLDVATRLLGRAAQIAAQTGNDEVTRRLKKVIDIDDAEKGTVRIKRADTGSLMELEMGATRTVRRQRTSEVTQ